MLNRSSLTAIFLACFTLSFLGCASVPTTMVTSTSPLPPGVRGSIPAYGSDCQYYLLGLIPFTGAPNSQAALTDAKEDAGSAVLTDVTIDQGSSYFILFSNQCIRVRGLGVKHIPYED